jgi:hypothetical protein
LAWLGGLEEKLLPKVRVWWRPLTCIWMSLTMLAHGVVLPVWHYASTGRLDTDLVALTALVSAITAALGVREWGKAKGND